MRRLFKLFCAANFLIFAAANYWEDRDDLIKLEESRMLGASIKLTEKEQIVNDILMGHKLKEHDDGFLNPGSFPPARHFFQAREDIEKSEVFKLIRKVPKGAALHGHDIGMASEDFVYGLTYKENLYACKVEGRLKLRFMQRADQDESCNWELLKDLRQKDPNYDGWVRSQITLIVDNPREFYKDINQVWGAFMNCLGTVDQIIQFRPVFEEYFYHHLLELYEDNVMYTEIRGTLNSSVYELDGTTYNPVEAVGLYGDVFKKFKRDHPDFWGARFIYTGLRNVNSTRVKSYVEILKDISSHHPEVVAGFDLASQEDLGQPLIEFIEELLPISGKYNLFFHAGETDWYGTTTDFNLIDAVLLGTKRIGHGYALTKHPQILNIIKKRGIAVEVCPISNQVLMLVEDLRNHPATSLFADGYPVVINADTPSFWKAKGLSYDFYEAFMGIASRNADLRVLKQLAINSLQYSAMPEEEKREALSVWRKKWDAFIDRVISESYKRDSQYEF